MDHIKQNEQYYRSFPDVVSILQEIPPKTTQNKTWTNDTELQEHQSLYDVKYLSSTENSKAESGIEPATY